MSYSDAAALDELDKLEVAHAAKLRYSQSESYQAWLASQYQQWHDLYAPAFGGDQWPTDAQFRPGKIHVTFNVVRPAIEIGTRLESLLPRIAIPTVGMDDDTRNRAEAAEQLVLLWLELSEWKIWLNTFVTTKRLYGKGVLKTWWDDDDDRPMVRVVENPAHLRIGWGASDYSTMDWALYEYALSPDEIMRKFPDIQVEIPADPRQPIRIIRSTDHSDPLGQRIQPASPGTSLNPVPRATSEYEKRQVPVWDYWYKNREGKVCNAILVADQVVSGPMTHPEMPDLPYIVAENIHEPSSPEGISEVQDIADWQIEYNRLWSHAFQHVADNIDPAWWYRGEDGASMPPGIVPKSGEVIDVGNGELNLVPQAANTPPFIELINAKWDDFHKRTGLPQILFGDLQGSDISGRAVAVQIESGSGRLDPRRDLTYAALRRLLRFWVYMASHKNPVITKAKTDPQSGETIPELRVKVVFDGLKRWNIVAPEITPRDVIEATQNELNKIQGRISSRRAAMDATGVDSPEAMIEEIKQENRDVYLSPETAQAIISIFPILQQMQAQQQQMQQQVNQATPPVPPSGLSAVAQSQVAQNTMAQQQAAAQPTYMQDQNTPQPMTQAGSPPPASGQQPATTPGGPATTTLIRGGRALNQLAFQSGGKSGQAPPVPGHP